MYTGFPHDRRFMLFKVDKQENMHVSQQTEMCLFTTAFAEKEPEGTTPKTVVVSYRLAHTFNKPDRKVSADTLKVPLTPEVDGLEKVSITMHSSPCFGFDMGEKYNVWFSDRFGYEVKLLYIGNNKRQVLGNMPPHVAAKQQRDGLSETAGGSSGSGSSWLKSLTSRASSLVGAVTGFGANEEQYEGVDEGISFADVAPYLVISSKSWEDAQKRLPEGEVMDISKFRPNIVVEGADAEYDEDYWAELAIGGDSDEHGGVAPAAKIVLTQNCARCNSLNVDYDTGKVGEGEAGKILKKLNKDRRVDPGAKWSPVFGRYGFLARVPEGKSAAQIRVGDRVIVTRRNAERTKFGEFEHQHNKERKKALDGA